MANGCFQLRMRMSTDDQINIRHRLCKDFILRLRLILPRTAMRHAGNHIDIFILLDFLYSFLNGLHRIFKDQFACRCAFQSICSKDTYHCNFYISLLKHNVIFHAVCFKSRLNLLLSVT